MSVELYWALAIALASGYLLFRIACSMVGVVEYYRRLDQDRRRKEMSRRILMRQIDEWDE